MYNLADLTRFCPHKTYHLPKKEAHQQNLFYKEEKNAEISKNEVVVDQFSSIILI